MSWWAKPSTLIAYALAAALCPLCMFMPGLPQGAAMWPLAGSWLAPPPLHEAGPNLAHWLALAGWTAHFVRRFAETARASYVRVRPVYELGASAWYAAISAYQGWSLRPASCIFDLTSTTTVACVLVGTALFIVGELGNAVHHTALARLRAVHASASHLRSTSRHSIPQGGMFELVSMPHYLFELVGFAGYALSASTLPSALFFVASVLTLVPRALESHQRYRHEFASDYPGDRKAIIPWLL
jgi:protein-S-isoprenylcysteine O-methyltransferase Ste14